MTRLSSISVSSPPASRNRERGGVRTVLLPLICFVVGLGAGAFWFGRPGQPVAANPNGNETNAPTAAGSGNSAGDFAPGASMQPTANAPVPPPPVTQTAIDEVKNAIPNLSSVSLLDGEQILRKAALADFAAAAGEMQKEVAAAEQSLADAQKSGSPSDQQAALKQLQEIQAQQTEKLQAIAAKSQAQIDALKKLKAGG